MPGSPSPQAIPWGGKVTLKSPGILHTGHCLGQTFWDGSFESPRTCPRIGVRTHGYWRNYTSPSTTSAVRIDFKLVGPAPNDTIWLNVTTSHRVNGLSWASHFARGHYDGHHIIVGFNGVAGLLTANDSMTRTVYASYTHVESHHLCVYDVECGLTKDKWSVDHEKSTLLGDFVAENYTNVFRTKATLLTYFILI